MRAIPMLVFATSSLIACKDPSSPSTAARSSSPTGTAAAASAAPSPPNSIANASRLPQITSASEDGFHDLVFAIEHHEVLEDGAQRLVAAGRSGGRVVQFEVLLRATWTSGNLSPDLDLVSHRGTVVIRRTGPRSDALVKVIDELYETKLAPRSMKATAEFTAISLQGDPSRLSAGPVKLKLFFETPREAEYAEIFLNVELEKRRLFLNEKDPDYRVPVVKALAY